jgi:hypothetical protein
VDIAVASEQDLCGTTTILITGGTVAGANAGRMMVTAYELPDLNPCQGSSGNGTTPLGWPGIYPDNSPLDYWAKPARLKFIKGNLILTGTRNLPPGQPQDETDIYTCVLSACSGAPATPVWFDQWQVPESGTINTPRAATCIDMDLVFDAVFTEPFAVVTAGATSRVNGATAVVTMPYRINLQFPPQPGEPATWQRWWTKGAQWNNPNGLNESRPTAIRCIPAIDGGTTLSGFNVYVAVQTLDIGGSGYVTLKYDGQQFTALNLLKPLSWQQNLPFYFGPGAGDDSPTGLAVEYKPGLTSGGEQRRVWVTGTSRHVTSLDDWATQFVVEQLP